MLDRVPPHDTEAEQTVIACCLSDPWALTVAVDQLAPADFYREAHRKLFGAVLDLHRKGSPVDLVTMRDALGDGLEDAGGWGYLVDLSGAVPTTAHIEHYCEIVSEKAKRREAIRVHQEALSDLYDPKCADPTTKALGSLMRVTVERSGAGPAPVGEAVGSLLDEIHHRIKFPNEARHVIDTPFYDLNQKVRIEQDDMFVLGARPSTGKTALALQLMLHVAEGRPVLFFSLEMSKRMIAARINTYLTGISVGLQMAGVLTPAHLAQLEEAFVTASALNYDIDDRPGLSAAQISATAHRKIVENGPLGLIVVDHMGHVSPADARAQERTQVSQIAHDLKNMARKLKTPVMPLVQLNRSVENENREPRSSDIRESGKVEELADIVALMHRPDRKVEHSPTKIAITKNRNGPVGDIELLFESSRMRFQNIKTRFTAPSGY